MTENTWVQNDYHKGLTKSRIVNFVAVFKIWRNTKYYILRMYAAGY